MRRILQDLGGGAYSGVHAQQQCMETSLEEAALTSKFMPESARAGVS